MGTVKFKDLKQRLHDDALYSDDLRVIAKLIAASSNKVSKKIEAELKSYSEISSVQAKFVADNVDSVEVRFELVGRDGAGTSAYRAVAAQVHPRTKEVANCTITDEPREIAPEGMDYQPLVMAFPPNTIDIPAEAMASIDSKTSSFLNKIPNWEPDTIGTSTGSGTCTRTHDGADVDEVADDRVDTIETAVTRLNPRNWV